MLVSPIRLIVLTAAVAAVAQSAQSTIEMDASGNVKAIVAGGMRLTPPVPYSYFQLDTEIAEAKQAGNGAYQLTTGTGSGVLRVSSGNGTMLHFEQAPASKAKNLSLVLTWPADAELHLAEYLNVGRLLDHDMPVGETYQGTLRYNFFVVHSQGTWVRFRAEEKQWQSKTSILVARHPKMFTVTFTWECGTDLDVEAFASMAEVSADTESWMRNQTGMKPLSERAGAPAWVRDVKMVITADMMRSNWEVVNDYQDLLKMAQEIARLRNPREVLFYVPGWEGPYDGGGPDYRPHPGLGGPAKFKELMNYLHEAGFHIMIHTTGWGIDPYLNDIDDVEKLAFRDAKGNIMGWETPFPAIHPPRISLKFKSPRVDLKAPPDAGVFHFQTDPAPDVCEALFTIGGAEGNERIRLTIGHGTLITPTGWFATHREYSFPFPLPLEPGSNDVKVEVIGGGWKEAWYQIRETYGPPSPYDAWTHPIVVADVSKPEYQRRYIESIRAVVNEYGVDAVHVDASTFFPPVGGVTPSIKDLILRLHQELPGVALGSEWFHSYEEMGFWHITQNARETLRDSAHTQKCPCEPTAVIPVQGRDKIYDWLNKSSPVSDFSRKFVLVYPHLCALDAFVPVGKVCNILPARQMPPVKSELWDVLRNATHLNYVPGFRVNYRGFGLDEDTRKAIQELR